MAAASTAVRIRRLPRRRRSIAPRSRDRRSRFLRSGPPKSPELFHCGGKSLSCNLQCNGCTGDTEAATEPWLRRGPRRRGAYGRGTRPRKKRSHALGLRVEVLNYPGTCLAHVISHEGAVALTVRERWAFLDGSCSVSWLARLRSC